MDATMEKSCLEEISHTVLDSHQKITVRSLSNNYSLSFLDAVKILQQWIDQNAAKAKLVREFIVRGVDPKRNGLPFITVASESKLKTIQSRGVDQLSSVLYGVEVAAEGSRKLNVPDGEQEFRVINLPLKTDKRDVKVFTPANPPAAVVAVKQEPKSKINSMFAGSSSKPAAATKSAAPSKPTPAPVKEEKPSPPKPEAKQSAAKSASPKKSPAKDAKKVVNGKGSIASFFSNKPAAAAASKPATADKVTVKTEKPSPKTPKEEPSKGKTNSNTKQQQDEEAPRWKRMISDESEDDEVIPNTPQEKKEAKKGAKKPLTFKKGAAANKTNPNKKSRIMQIEDSSEEEEEDREDKNMREPEERLIKFDAEESEDTPEVVEQPEKTKASPEKSVENDSNGLNRKRAKVKKLVTRNFMDDEGYMTTVKEYVMVSASEDEADEEVPSKKAAVEKKESPKVTAAPESGKGKTDKKTADKKPSKVTPPAAKTKQGSIMSFFSKK